MKKYFAIVLFAVLAVGLCVPAVFAQASGTVKGVCKDAQGNPVADGVVVWNNMDNGQKYPLKTNKKGEYFSLGLTPGKYNVILYKSADDQKAGKEMDHVNGFTVRLDENSLDFDIKKGWFFTVMKIDPMQMKKKPDGSYEGEVTPTRFTFASEKLIYPLKITQLSVKDKTEALFYVQAPYKVDLPGDMTYQYQWIPMIQNAQGWYAKGIFGTHELPGKADDWLKDARDRIPEVLRKGQELGFNFVSGQRPEPNKQGRIATTLEWAKQLTADDIKLLKGGAAYSEKVPDPDAGFTQADVKDPKKAEAVYKVINERLAKYQKDRPGGYLVREAPADDIKQLKILAGHLKEGQFVTKIRKTYTKGEMEEDLLIVPAKLGEAVDRSEYEEVLPTSPP